MYVLKTFDQNTLLFKQIRYEPSYPDYIALSEGTLQGVVILRYVKKSFPDKRKLYFSDEQGSVKGGFCIIAKRVKDFKEYQAYLDTLNTS